MDGASLPRIIFVNRYFFPDCSASSQILSDLAFYLAERGESVEVITSRQLYGDPSAHLPPREIVKGVRVRRVATTRFGRHTVVSRAFDYASFYVSVALALLLSAKTGMVIVAKTDPPLLSVIVSAVARLRGATTINWLQDLYPEIAAEVGVAGFRGRFGHILADLRNWSLRQAQRNVVIGEDMAARVTALGIAKERLAIVSNWSDDDRIVPCDAASNPLRRAWSLDDRFVVIYSGNLGRAHEFQTILNAAERLHTRSDIIFVMIGDGNSYRELKSLVGSRGISNFRFLPPQPREALPLSLAVADVHWLSLRPALDGLVLPSKFYGIAAAGRPIIVVGSCNGELARLVTRHDCGAVIAEGDGAGLAAAISNLASDRTRCLQLGANARRMLENAHLTKADALERWHAILVAAASGPQ